MNCPKCGSQDLYRKNPLSMTVHCDRCQHSFQARQTQQPLLKVSRYSSKLGGRYYVSVWLHPVNTNCYSFSYSVGGSLPVRFNEFASDPYLSGCYSSPEEALEAGENEAV